jgi:ubiquinone/menaquinone biosynthesis C-methylase UbiE
METSEQAVSFYSHYIFPRILDVAMSGNEFQELRKSLLADVSGEVFEIGFGTGLNLPHYPSNVKRITTVDPNTGARRLAQRRITESPIEVVHQTRSGEQLNLPSESFDSVVCTFTLCSIANVNAAMAEMRRLLRRGGRMFFMEHGISNDPRIQWWQSQLTPLNRIIGDGCHLNRDPRGTISASGLRIDRLDNFYLKKAPKFAGFIYRGVAVK